MAIKNFLVWATGSPFLIVYQCGGSEDYPGLWNQVAKVKLTKKQSRFRNACEHYRENKNLSLGQVKTSPLYGSSNKLEFNKLKPTDWKNENYFFLTGEKVRRKLGVSSKRSSGGTTERMSTPNDDLKERCSRHCNDKKSCSLCSCRGGCWITCQNFPKSNDCSI